ncbi:MAG: response regulator [Nitrospirae bacterium]|nr:response regulator [Nitrospirota bacterium]
MKISLLFRRTHQDVLIIVAVIALVNFVFTVFSIRHAGIADTPEHVLVSALTFSWPLWLMLACFSVVLFRILNKLINEPLNAIIDYAKKLVDHEYDAKIDIDTNDEFDALSSILQFLAIDITEIFERFEEAAGDLAERDAKLTSIYNYLEAVIDNMADGLMVVNAAGEITRVNKPLAYCYGINASEAIGKMVEQVFGKDMSLLFKRSIGTGFGVPVASDIELSPTMVLKASSTVVRVHGLGGGQQQSHDVNDVVIITSDVTRERNIDRMKTDFISTVSHELRTPLTSILGFTEIIQERLKDQIFPNLPADSKKIARSIKLIEDNIGIIIGEGMRLTSLINDVLDIAKMESGKVDWKNETLHVEDIIKRAAQTTKALCDKAGLEFIVAVEPDMPPIVGDGDRLVQVVINLISNAIKFTADGSVTCRASRQGSEVVISVSDTGIGINPRDRESIFEKFRQVGDTLTDKPKGTGLGLPISKQIVNHHKGRIWVEDNTVKGSTFSFTLPLPSKDSYRLTSTDLDTLVRTIRGGTAEARTRLPYSLDNLDNIAAGGKNILVVDDDENIRELLTQELQGQGYNVRTAKNGMEAIKSIKEMRPHLIILDVMMPEVSGFDVAAVIKGDPATADVPVIILSIIEDAERGRRLGVDRYLTKPINKELLFNDIKTLLAGVTSKKKIMVVDENESNVKTLTDVLLAKGYSVVSATDGTGSIEKARTERPDIIIVDATLSERDQLVKTMRFEKEFENVYFIYLYGPENPNSHE